MPIVSISLNDQLLKEIDDTQRKFGFSGRSEIIRTGIRMLNKDYKQKEDLFGDMDGVFLVVHNQNVEDTVTEIKHKFDDVITTHIHSPLREKKCLEIFIIKGEAERIKKLLNLFQTNKNINYVKLIVA